MFHVKQYVAAVEKLFKFRRISPQTFLIAASDMCGGSEKPCAARLTSQEAPTMRNAKAIPVILKKVTLGTFLTGACAATPLFFNTRMLYNEKAQMKPFYGESNPRYGGCVRWLKS